MVNNTTQHLPPPHPHTFCIPYTVRLLWEERRGGEVREKVEGQQLTRGVENTNVTGCISSL